jgi:glycosyltransferase involved in cell wall biosynthesis
MSINLKPILLVNQTQNFLFDDIASSVAQRFPISSLEGPRYIRTSLLLRVFTWCAYTFKLILHLTFASRKYSKLLIFSNPPLAPLIAPLARLPYALILFDLYPLVLSQVKPNYVLIRILFTIFTNFWHFLNSFIVPRAERVFVLSTAMASELRQYFSSDSIWADRVVVIPPWADTTTMLPSPVAADEFRTKFSIDGFLVTYSGNLGLTHPLEFLLEASALLINSSLSSRIQILFIGCGPKRNSLESQARELQLPQTSLRFLNPLPYNDVPASLSAADIAVVALDSLSASASLPSKTFNALACGTPVLALAPESSALSQLILKHNCGFVIEPGPDAPQNIADFLCELAANPDQLQKLSDNALLASCCYTSSNASSIADKWLGAPSVH